MLKLPSFHVKYMVLYKLRLYLSDSGERWLIAELNS